MQVPLGGEPCENSPSLRNSAVNSYDYGVGGWMAGRGGGVKYYYSKLLCVLIVSLFFKDT